MGGGFSSSRSVTREISKHERHGACEEQPAGRVIEGRQETGEKKEKRKN